MNGNCVEHRDSWFLRRKFTRSTFRCFQERKSIDVCEKILSFPGFDSHLFLCTYFPWHAFPAHALHNHNYQTMKYVWKKGNLLTSKISVGLKKSDFERWTHQNLAQELVREAPTEEKTTTKFSKFLLRYSFSGVGSTTWAVYEEIACLIIDLHSYSVMMCLKQDRGIHKWSRPDNDSRQLYIRV